MGSPSFLAISLLLVATGLARDGPADACWAAVNSDAAFADEDLRRAHCSSYFAAMSTPSEVTVVNATPTPGPVNTEGRWRRDEPGCSHDLPDYASGCDDAAYQSACFALGFMNEMSLTRPVPPATTTYFRPSLTAGAESETAQTVTGTTTILAGNDRPTSSVCLDDAKAQYFVDGFKDLLEYTSYNGTRGPHGRGYHQAVSDAILATGFQDWSDSINWMAGKPLGSVTFSSKAAFDYGQGKLQPELRVTTLNIWHSCNTVTWRWSAKTSSNATVTGINQMALTADLSKIQTNYAEFDNAAWLASFGLQCTPQS